jgi:rsbT co-antagonist protein RsbR
VARHLITTASAVRLMGGECIITGIRARIAQTLVELGVDLSGFLTRTTLADGLEAALGLTKQSIG